VSETGGKHADHVVRAFPRPSNDSSIGEALTTFDIERRGSMMTLELTRLQDSFTGPVLGPGDNGYEDARKVWNAMIDRRPAVILQCADTSDVVSAVRFAREQDLLTTVRVVDTTSPASPCATAAP